MNSLLMGLLTGHLPLSFLYSFWLLLCKADDNSVTITVIVLQARPNRIGRVRLQH